MMGWIALCHCDKGQIFEIGEMWGEGCTVPGRVDQRVVLEGRSLLCQSLHQLFKVSDGRIPGS